MRRTARGFTLVELMVAVGILALLGAAAASLLGNTLNHQTQIRERGDALEALALSLTIMRRDLEQVSARQGRDSYGDHWESALQTYDSSDPMRLEFTSHGRRQFPGSFAGSSLQRVRYRLEQGVLYREIAPVPEPVANTRWLAQRLMDDVEALTFEYYSDDQWLADWPSLNQPGQLLPEAVAILLTTKRWGELRLLALTPSGVSDAP